MDITLNGNSAALDLAFNPTAKLGHLGRSEHLGHALQPQGR
jgi:hypothetical protein